MRIRCVLALLLAFVMMTFPALAEDVFVVSDWAAASGVRDEAYIAAHLTTELDYVRLEAQLSEEETEVVVSVRDPQGKLVYQRDYGLCSGRFRTENIYLRLLDVQTEYCISVTAGDAAYEFPLVRVMPRLKGNTACAVGLPMTEVSGGSGWLSATVLDLRALDGSSLTVPMHAANAYELGSVTFTVRGGELYVNAEIANGVDGTIDRAKIQIATNAITAQKLGKKGFAGMTAALDEGVPLDGAVYAVVLVELTVSFDPAGVPGSPNVTLPGQEALWEDMQNSTENEAVG